MKPAWLPFAVLRRIGERKAARRLERAFARDFQPDEDVLFHTNTFWTEGMRQVQMPDDAVYSAQAPQFLRGRPLYDSASSGAIVLRSFWKGMSRWI